MTNEANFRAAWLDQGIHELDPFDMAVAGGSIAADQATVFIAGYQAAIRRCFSSLSKLSNTTQWSSFAASEREPLAATEDTITKTVLLHGEKTWIAAIDHVENLIVQVREDGTKRFYYVPVDTPGLNLKPNSSPRMLPDLSQGIAQFDNVSVSLDYRLPDTAAKNFPATEATMFLIALCAAISNDKSLNDVPELAALAMEVTGNLPRAASTKIEELRGMYSRLNSILREEAATTGNSDSIVQKCKDLIALYSRGLQNHH